MFRAFDIHLNEIQFLGVIQKVIDNRSCIVVLKVVQLHKIIRKTVAILGRDAPHHKLFNIKAITTEPGPTVRSDDAASVRE